MLGRFLVGASIAWPLVAGSAVWQLTTGNPAWPALVYTVGGHICHQRPERSFHTHEVKWPVCARCAGLYLAAPFAGLVALRRRSRDLSRRQPLRLVFAAAVPTALTLAWEWGGLGTPSNLVRFATALPLGAAVAFVLVTTVTEPGRSESIG